MTCPHPGLQVGGYCYWCLKCRALNGHRSKLTEDQAGFIGLLTQPRDTGWIQPSLNEQELQEAAVQRELQAGWLYLARKILEPDKKKAK